MSNLVINSANVFHQDIGINEDDASKHSTNPAKAFCE